LTDRDAAFEALVARHGPMVLSVCRGMLRDPNDVARRPGFSRSKPLPLFSS
jgi:hypothetical protein